MVVSMLSITSTESMEPDITLDVCGLEPPEPLERVLEALSQLKPEQRLCMLIDREPRPLYRILEANGYHYSVNARPDYLYEITIQHKE